MPAPVRIDSVAHLRVGTIDGPETTTLSAPVSAARLSDRRIFVVESGGRRARLLDADGQFLRWIGGVGEGPAEFSNAGEGGVLPGDTLWIRDSGRRRVVLYTPDGDFARAFGYGEPGGASRVRFLRFLADGSVMHVASTLGEPAALQAGGRFEERILVHLLDREGNEVARLADLPGTLYEISVVGGGADGPQMVTIEGSEPLLSPVTQVAADAEGRVWTGDGAGFELRRLDAQGRPIEVFRAPIEPVEVTGAMFDRYVEASVANAPEQAREGQQAFLRDQEYSDVLPAFERLTVDGEGRAWVSEYTRHEPDRLPRRWWVLEPGGDLVGRVQVPAGFRPLEIRDDEILGVERDELEVPYLVGYHVQWEG